MISRSQMGSQMTGNRMPIRKVKGGYKWGSKGKVYKDRKGAEKQAAAAYASGYKEPKKMRSGGRPTVGVLGMRGSSNKAAQPQEERRAFSKMPSYASSKAPPSMLETLSSAASKMPARSRTRKMEGGGYLKSNIDGRASRGKTKGRYC